MVQVEFLGPIGLAPIQVDIKNLQELKKILKEKDELKDWLINSAVAVNDELVNDLDYELKNGDRISLLPPVCGG